MKPDWEDNYELQDEYDFSKSIRNPYFQQDFRELNLVSIDGDLKTAFPDSAAVNAALRKVLNLQISAGSNLKKAS
jgi:hypothetical protein